MGHFKITAAARHGRHLDLTITTETGAADVRVDATCTDEEISAAVADVVLTRERSLRPQRYADELNLTEIETAAAAMVTAFKALPVDA